MPPFVAYSTSHIVVILIIVALSILFPLLIKRTTSEPVTTAVAISLGIIILLSKIFEPFFRIASFESWRHVLPLHLCDIGGILTGIMLINRSYVLYEINYFWALGGTAIAVLTPELRYGFPHVDFYFYFFTHGLIIVCAIFATVVFNYRPTLKSITRAFLATVAYATFVAPVNWLLGTNYLYLCAKPTSKTLIDYLGPWPWYLLTLVPVSFLIFFIYYSPFWIADLVRKKPSQFA
ncbi:MAG TPA: TIGR02206 family membrane protein [bacterium]